MEEGQEPQGTGEPVTERARIAGVEAGIAAGLVPSTEAVARPRSEPVENASGSASSDVAPQASDSPSGAEVLASYELPDWTDPPTLQVPRVLLDLEQEAAVERGGPPPTPPGGPVWRERQEDWNDSDAVLSDLASGGLGVTASEESSSDDPFAYDFLDHDGELSWIARNEAPDPSTQMPRAADTPSPLAEPVPLLVDVPEAPGGARDAPAAVTLPDDSEEAAAAPVQRRRHVARRARRGCEGRQRRGWP